MKQYVMALLLAGGLGSWAEGADYYVNNKMGDDASTGGFAEYQEPGIGPLRTINEALKRAGFADRVILANTGEPYRECLSIQRCNHSGLPTLPFVLEGNGATLDGSQPVPAYAWEAYKGNTARFRPHKKTYPMLYLDGKPAERVAADDTALEPPTLQPLQWCYHHQWVYFEVEQLKMPQDYPLSMPIHDVGITIYKAQQLVVADLTVQGFRLDGINAHDATYTLLAGATCRGNGRSGVAVSAASRIQLRNVLLGNNGQGAESTDSAQLWLEGRSQTVVQGSHLVANTAPDIHKEGPHALLEVIPIADGEEAPNE